jgi:iron(III) transport system permease protein
VLVALVLPVGALVLRSFQVQEVRTTDGRVLRAVGEVDEGPEAYMFAVQADPRADRIPVRLPRDAVAGVHTVWSLEHYAVVLGDDRTRAQVRNSVAIGLGSALVALLLGLPAAWCLGRTHLVGRRLLSALVVGPAILPPLVVAMGAGKPLGDALHGLLGLEGVALQLGTAMVVFGAVLFPVVTLLVGRAMGAVPAGLVESARLLGGHGAAWRRVVLPAVLPAVFGAAVLVFTLALSDFAVPNVLGFTLSEVTIPANLFPTEILLQWKHQGNTGRAVATGAPLLLLTGALVAAALALLRRSPVVAGGEGGHGRARLRLGRLATLGGWVLVAVPLLLGLALPLASVAHWAGGGGVSVASPGGAPGAARQGRLFDFGTALANTPGWREDVSRWLQSGIGAAVLATLVSVVLVRWALRSGRAVRLLVLALGAAPLAVPGLVFTVGTLQFWLGRDLGGLGRGILPSVLVLAARFLPFALAGAWLALREVRPGQEESATVLGATAPVRAWRIWGPLAGPGIVVGGLLVLVLALREVDAVILVDPRILPLRLFDKIHFSRLADEANLAFLYVGLLLVPLLAGAFVLGWGARRRRVPARDGPVER